MVLETIDDPVINTGTLSFKETVSDRKIDLEGMFERWGDYKDHLKVQINAVMRKDVKHKNSGSWGWTADQMADVKFVFPKKSGEIPLPEGFFEKVVYECKNDKQSDAVNETRGIFALAKLFPERKGELPVDLKWDRLKDFLNSELNDKDPHPSVHKDWTQIAIVMMTLDHPRFDREIRGIVENEEYLQKSLAMLDRNRRDGWIEQFCQRAANLRLIFGQQFEKKNIISEKDWENIVKELEEQRGQGIMWYSIATSTKILLADKAYIDNRGDLVIEEKTNLQDEKITMPEERSF